MTKLSITQDHKILPAIQLNTKIITSNKVQKPIAAVLSGGSKKTLILTYSKVNTFYRYPVS